MQDADTILTIYQKRGAKGLPLEGVYKHLLDTELFLRAYGKIYRNFGAMTRGATKETVDGMSLQRIHAIIGLLRAEKWRWTPVRRMLIPKANGKMRPLGIPSWSDKLIQEVTRVLLESYYEQRFSEHSHGFRPDRGCQTALREVREKWTGTVWFIEGDIKGCFDNIDHALLLEIIWRDIHDNRLLKLIDGLLKAGYMEDWRYFDSLSGTPQGGIISPLLANIYLNELDRFVEDTLIPAYTSGRRRKTNPTYAGIGYRLKAARDRSDLPEVKRLIQQRRQMTSYAPYEPGYRRLRYVRYADDFLLGFVGPKEEAKEIRDRLGEWLAQKLRLTLSEEKTLITHAHDDKARFLGYEITVTRQGSLISADGKGAATEGINRRATNGKITLLMPKKVVDKYRDRFGSKGKIIHSAELMAETEYTIVSRYQSVLRGIYNYYCMAINVSKRMSYVRWILENSLTKTLAGKLKCKVTRIYRTYEAEVLGLKVLRVVVERPNKEPLVAIFGGIPFERKPEGMGVADFVFRRIWHQPAGNRSEVVQRLLADKCELCGVEGEPIEVHHIRALADIDRAGRRPKESWEKIMAARKRKTLVVCRPCHNTVTYGQYDGPKL